MLLRHLSSSHLSSDDWTCIGHYVETGSKQRMRRNTLGWDSPRCLKALAKTLPRPCRSVAACPFNSITFYIREGHSTTVYSKTLTWMHGLAEGCGRLLVLRAEQDQWLRSTLLQRFVIFQCTLWSGSETSNKINEFHDQNPRYKPKTMHTHFLHVVR
jgi:hypothetical protein